MKAEPTVPEGYMDGAATTSAFANFVGPLYERVDAENRPWRAIRIRPEHGNMASMAHGGLLMTLADLVLSQVIRHAAVGPSITVRMTTDFVGPAHDGDWLEGTGRIDRATSSLIFCSGWLQVGTRTILTCTGLFARIRADRANAKT